MFTLFLNKIKISLVVLIKVGPDIKFAKYPAAKYFIKFRTVYPETGYCIKFANSARFLKKTGYLFRPQRIHILKVP